LRTDPLKCPRDGVLLENAKEHNIQIDRCPSCKGAWYDNDELAILETTAGADADQRRGSIDYAVRDSSLSCPICNGPLQAFNYRAYNLELDACKEQHGFWLDGGEAERVKEIMRERIRGLERSAQAQVDWDKTDWNRPDGVLTRLRNLFR
jgi:Zn-finger nucleic acid-binding protein